MIGYDTTPAATPFGTAIHMDFRSGSLELNTMYASKDFGMEGSNTVMCDRHGNLLFYSNGCEIVNAKAEIMLNGDGINPGLVETEYCIKGNSGSPIIQGVIALPAPGSDSLYYVFSLDLLLPYQDSLEYFALAPEHVYYHVVDMTQDSGYGAVTLKNQVAVNDTFARGGLQAVRHANGKDWWLIVAKSHSNCYFIVPVTEAGVQPPIKQCIGHVWNDFDSETQVTFTPDGKKYIRFNGWNGLNIFDFDAASGALSNPLVINFPNDTIRSVIGAAVSPNSRYLYTCTGKYVYQHDLQASDIAASRIKIATFDGYQNPFPTIFYLAALAPNGKIYISNFSSTYNLHVINKPNCGGLDCELVQHGITLPAYNAASIPNVPHYRQSWYECDSTLIGLHQPLDVMYPVQLFPNPAMDWVGFETETIPQSVLLFDAMGRQLAHPVVSSEAGQVRINTGHLPAGMYWLRFRAAGRDWGGKFVKY